MMQKDKTSYKVSKVVQGRADRSLKLSHSSWDVTSKGSKEQYHRDQS